MMFTVVKHATLYCVTIAVCWHGGLVACTTRAEDSAMPASSSRTSQAADGSRAYRSPSTSPAPSAGEVAEALCETDDSKRADILLHFSTSPRSAYPHMWLLFRRLGAARRTYGAESTEYKAAAGIIMNAMMSSKCGLASDIALEWTRSDSSAGLMIESFEREASEASSNREFCERANRETTAIIMDPRRSELWRCWWTLCHSSS